MLHHLAVKAFLMPSTLKRKRRHLPARRTLVPDATPGTLMMWPSPVHHYVHPNLCDDVRISISFNLILRDGPGVPSMAAR